MDIKVNEGVIFKNDKKPEGSKQPDYRGEINCDGVKKEIALWVRKSEAGKSYFSVKISEPYQAQEKREPQRQPVEQPSDDLPF